MPDPDAPDCPESIRFWCFTSGKYFDREKVSVTGSTTAKVKTTAEGMASLMASGTDMPGASSLGPVGVVQPTLASLTDVVKSQQAAAASAADPKKRAPKSKVKKEKKEEPKDTKGKKTAARTSSQIRNRVGFFTFFNLMSTSGIKIRSMDAHGPRVDPLFQIKYF